MPPSSRSPKKNSSRGAPKSSRNKKGAAKEEPVVVEKPPPPPKKTTFETIFAEVWLREGNAERQRRKIAEILKIPDAPMHSLESLTLDEAYSHLVFARDSFMNPWQTEAFYQLMTRIKIKMRANLSLEDTYKYFKNHLLWNSELAVSLVENGSLQPPVEVAEQMKKMEEEKKAAAERAAKQKAEAEAAAKEKKGKSKRGKAAAEPVKAEPEPKPETGKIVDPRAQFSKNHLKLITEYMTNGIFAHFALYQASYQPKVIRPGIALHYTPSSSFHSSNPEPAPGASVSVAASSGEFLKNILTETEDLRLETVIPDGMMLADATDLDSEDALKAEADREAAKQQLILELADMGITYDDTLGELSEDPITKMVQLSVFQVRQQMTKAMRDYQKELDGKLQVIESKLAKPTKNKR